MLEPAAAAFAARRATPRDVEQLRKNHDNYKEYLAQENLVGVIRADIQFHRMVANATENRTIEVLMNTITRYDFHGWKAALRTKTGRRKPWPEHKRIIDAIADGDEKKAEKTMRDHLIAARKNLDLLDTD